MQEEPNLHHPLAPPRVVAARRFLVEVQGVAARYAGRAIIEWENYTATALELWPALAAEAEEVLRSYPNHPDASYPQRLLEAARREEIAWASEVKVEVRVEGHDGALVHSAWAEIDGCAQRLGAGLEDGVPLAALPPTVVPFLQQDGSIYYRSGGRRYVFRDEAAPGDVS